MKKYLILGAIVVVFIGYSLVLRNQKAKPLVIAPSPANNNSSAQTGSGTGSTTTQTPANITYKDGTYTGSTQDAYYGNVQVAAVISGGKITAVNFLQAPNDNPNSNAINSQAKPYLSQEAVQAQSSKVSIVTGATLTSQAFIQSLMDALSQAK